MSDNQEAVDTESLPVSNVEPAPAIVEQAKPIFFSKPEKLFRVEVEILSDPKNGNIQAIFLKQDIEKMVDLGRVSSFVHTSHWFDFTLPNYEMMTDYRTRCQIFKDNSERPVIDSIRMRHLLIVRHLKQWSLTDENGEQSLLVKMNDGSLTDESVVSIYALPPSLVDVVMSAFERDALLFSNG
jgi:hypothetical protein